ncbi:MAG: lamin tail domain-containing protein [Bryobacteraceae bacterium]
MRYLLLLLSAAALNAQSVVISQVYGGGGNTGALWRNDFVELFNRGTEAVSLAGWSVQYAAATGTTWQVAALDGVVEPGQYFLVQLAAGTGGTQSLPAPDATGTLPLAAAAGKVVLVQFTTPLNELANRPFIQDLVGYGTAANDFKIAPTPDLSNTTAAIRAGGGCIDTGNNRADFAIGAPNPRNRATARIDCGAAPIPALRLKIGEIQGGGDTSPFADKKVITRGVVYARRTSGFYIQSLPGDQDSDDATSEGILVFTGGAPPAESAVGNVVDVEGVVAEFKPASDPASPTLTEITAPVVTVLSNGRSVPEPVALAGTEWERFEGMRIRATLTAASPTGGTFNETRGDSTSNGIFYAVPGGPRPFRRPGLNGDETNGRLRVDSRALTGSTLELRPGEVLRNLTGPLDFGARTYTLLPEALPTVTSPGVPSAVPAPLPGEFTIATLNLERFFETATAFPVRLAKLKLYVRDILRSPDIIAVQEVGNQAALDRVATELGGYRAFVGATNDPSGIAPGFLVKAATVTVITAAPFARDARFGSDNQLVHDRPPYRLDARIGSQRLALVCVHLRSLIDVEDPRVQAKRRAQAESINSLGRTIAGENIPFAILGDFNSFPFDDGYADMLAIVGGGLNLTNINPLLKNGDNHSYVFNGATQALDHILLSPAMRQWITRAAYAGGNADYPESLRANAASPARISDHDAAIAWFRLDLPPITSLSVTNAATYRSGSIAPNELLTVFGRDLAGTRIVINGRAAPIVHQSQSQTTIAAPPDLPVTGTVELALERSGQRLHAFQIPVAPSAPALFDTRPSGRGGDVVELWGTGSGTNQEAAARICGLPAQVLFSGQAPGLITGAW